MTSICVSKRSLLGVEYAVDGGDEFVVLITGEYASREMAIRQALNVASKIQASIGGNYQLHGYEHAITTSIGITLFPEDHETAADVLKQLQSAGDVPAS